MKNIFPLEIQEYTTQSHWVKRHIKSRIIYLVILVTLFIVAVSLPFIDIDITSQSRGTIRTPHENNNIQSVIYGQITRSDIFENKCVTEGDTLVWLKIDDINEQERRIMQRTNENESFINDLNNLLIGNRPITPKYKREEAQFSASLRENKVLLEQAKTEYEVSRKLYDKGVESKFDFDKVESNYKSYQSQFNSLQQQRLSIWEAERTRLELDNKDLYSELQKLRYNNYQYFITAPITGNIVQYTGLKAGNIVSPGQTLGQITPKDNLLVEAFIPPNDIGYINIGQLVKFQIDAFNYQQWGLIDGEVTEIISDVVQADGLSYFRVRCSLNKDYLELSNGYKGYIKKGMTLTARFYLTKRSLAQLLFDDLNNWLNPKIMDNGHKN